MSRALLSLAILAVRFFSSLAALAVLAGSPSSVHAQTGSIGIVIMHGKGGLPTGLVAGLARNLEGRGYLVANLEMPWSGNRNYDVPVARGEEEVAAAVAGLRVKGATKVFVAGHSQGGVFALYLAGRLTVDGTICIAPGGNVDHYFFWPKVRDGLARARQLVGEGKGSEPAPLDDFEGARGSYQVVAVPAAYVTWFDPDGAMNMERAARAVRQAAPVLWIVPQREVPGMRKTNIPTFRSLPAHPLTRLYEPDSDHRGAPGASVDEIARWTSEVAASLR
ncbi:MAG TPA: alpha/beta hydrolase [Burkholderiales bacterium]|nr:alpha/beta hydrolase [Burkholderiales bacterium]